MDDETESTNYPPRFSSHDYVPLEESATSWEVGDYSEPTENGVMVHAAAYDMENDRLFCLRPQALDYETESYNDYELVTWDSQDDEEQVVGDVRDIPQDVREGMHEVLGSLLHLSGMELSPEATDKLLETDTRLDRQVEELTEGFDPRMLLPAELTGEEQKTVEQFAAELGGREGDAALASLRVDDAAQRLAESRDAEPDNTALHAKLRLEKDALIDETARIEPEDLPTYGEDTGRYSNQDLRDAAAQAEAAENASIARARSWVEKTRDDDKDTRQEKDNGQQR